MKKKKLVLHKENLHKVLESIPNNLNISIISILGPYRTGKSFLMNCLIDWREGEEEEEEERKDGIHLKREPTI